MKRWEVAKGFAEGKFPVGTRFTVKFEDGDTGEAFIDEYNALRWDVDGQNGLVCIASLSNDEWTAHEKMVTIKQSRLDYLEERVEFLNCLEACGVDNWEGYGDAYQMLEEDE